MSFIRNLSIENINKLTSTNGQAPFELQHAFTRNCNYLKLNAEFNAALFAMLKADVANGTVFPAVRDNELHFYYKGGCLFKFAKGAFLRDINYEKYNDDPNLKLSFYDKAKAQNAIKNTNVHGQQTERQLLDNLYRYTYNKKLQSKVVVLDIEVNLRNDAAYASKCDLVLLNTEKDELMFVEGKVYSDKRVKCAVGYTPEVIKQVEAYTKEITEQKQLIIEQYGNYVEIVNRIFDTDYKKPNKLIEPTKLIVYRTGGGFKQNVNYTIQTVNRYLGKNNVMWIEGANEPTLDEIWLALNGDL